MSFLVCVYFYYVELFYIYAYVVLMLSTFLVNYVSALVLFDVGAIWSFVSTSFCRDFTSAREALDRPMRVTIDDDHIFQLLRYTRIVCWRFSMSDFRLILSLLR